ncbi:hypothetical protein [Fibrobacter sp. UWB2]|uniref:hypothetical protein n=1 Tax=Fibrobacter sp. UWB2 TaxID=1964358 RepID=UPI001182A77E|nr:hypothetical protein [Fibrobacter sp. UWB2]
MENISKMEMANALFNKPYIKTKKKFFGFKTNVTYTKTNSPVVGICLEFSPTEGQKVQAIVEASLESLDATIQREGRPKTSDNGNLRLNLCYSQDREFVALHLQQFSGFEYHTLGEIRFAEGDEAHKLLAAFMK